MKSKLCKPFLSLFIAISLLAGTGVTQAWWCHNGYCHGARYYHHGCRWIPGHRGPYGGWIQGHRNCW